VKPVKDLLGDRSAEILVGEAIIADVYTDELISILWRLEDDWRSRLPAGIDTVYNQVTVIPGLCDLCPSGGAFKKEAIFVQRVATHH